MADTESTETNKRFRSPPYPAIPLGKAIERAKQLYGKALHHPVGVSVLADGWKYGPKSSGLWATAAALIQYGLLKDEGSGDKRKFTLTEIALRVVRDPNPESEKRLEIIKRCAVAPKIFYELWSSFGNAQSLSDIVFKSHLTVDRSDHGLAPYSDAAADDVIKVYKETIAFAKLGDSDTVSPTGEDKGEVENDLDPSLLVVEPVALADKPPQFTPPAKSDGKVKLMDGERIVFTEESNPHNYLKLIANGDVDETMLEALEDYVKRQKRRLGGVPGRVATGAQVPFMITSAQKQTLREMGYDDAAISQMTPAQSAKILGILG